MNVWSFLESLKNIVANVDNWIGIILIKIMAIFFYILWQPLLVFTEEKDFFFPKRTIFEHFKKKAIDPNFFLVGINDKWKRIKRRWFLFFHDVILFWRIELVKTAKSADMGFFAEYVFSRLEFFEYDKNDKDW